MVAVARYSYMYRLDVSSHTVIETSSSLAVIPCGARCKIAPVPRVQDARELPWVCRRGVGGALSALQLSVTFPML